jgi:hypothetical protein
MQARLCLFGVLFLLGSCISNRRLLKACSSKELKSIENINGKYVNLATENKIQLFKTLNECLDIDKGDSIFYSNAEHTAVQLNYDGGKYLDVSLLRGDAVLKNIELKVKNKGHYLSVKRHLFLVPIPFLFYVHFERKAILFTDAAGNLVAVNGNDQFIWVLMAGGNNTTHVHKHFRKHM